MKTKLIKILYSSIVLIPILVLFGGCRHNPTVPSGPILSDGVYRIPYENGKSVHVTNDHNDHNPIGPIDMNASSGNSPHKIVAAADGTIRAVVDSFSARIDSDTGAACTNNYVWIEHPNGEWSKYSHMQQNSSTINAGLSIGITVTGGQYLGDEGEVGCASGPHLHFEIGVPQVTNPFTVTGGFLNDNAGSSRNRIPRICGIQNELFVSGGGYVARGVPGNMYPGSSEVARHGVPEQDYQCLFDQAVNGGYELVFVDVFDVNGNTYFNTLFRPKGNYPWASFHGLNSAQYQQKFDQYVADGYRPTLVESYRGGGGVLYTVIFKKISGPEFFAYHGISASDHQTRFENLTKDGWRPKNVSVVSNGGNRSYAALYEKINLGNYQLKSSVPVSQYQALFDQNFAAGRQIIYLNGYNHNGVAHLSTIWSSLPSGPFKARHGLSSSQYQTEWESANASNLQTQIVTGYESGNSTRYAAVWRN